MTPTITVCTGTLHPSTGCAEIPVLSADCINLVGGLSFFNQEISSAEVPAGFVCTFFRWVSSKKSGEVLLTGGVWELESVPGLSGMENFDKMTSSLVCSPI
ncbi:hypothetical protein FB45DRAFT_843973 [Roridomyces roridus]|uniref:Uncharacterized protein n=1 Tax=Roridomyces roridus TaxID=1738132 RepID=A0AAD7FBY3_9AGAR|nr:hypothetical protein FB45DRAFT_843973 [Roridomyces roridus]